jgi:hypothetical protein
MNSQRSKIPGSKTLIIQRYTVKKVYCFSRPQTGCHCPNSPWPGIFKLFPARDSLVSDISDGKNDNLFYSASRLEIGLDPAFLFAVTNTGFTGLRLNLQRSKIQGLDQRYLNLRTDPGSLSPDPRCPFCFSQTLVNNSKFFD